MSSRTEPRERAGYVNAVGVLTAVALAVRLPGLDTGLWVDEIVSIVEAFRTPFPQSLAEFPYDHKHPLYSLLAHACIVIFGEHAWSVRLPALVFGVAAVPLLYKLGTQVTSRAEALAAAGVLALSYHHVWFSQNARGYTMLAFWTILSTLMLIRALGATGTKTWIVYGAIIGLGVYTHLTFVFIAAGQGFAVLVSTLGYPRTAPRPRMSAPLIGYAAGAAIALLLYAPMLDPLVNFFLTKESQLRGVSTPGWALAEGLRVLGIGFGIVGAVGGAVLIIVAVVGLTGVMSYARSDPRTALIMMLPAAAMLIGALTVRGTMYPRFFFALIGPLIMIWMRGLFVVSGWLALRAGVAPARARHVSAVAAAVVVAVSALSVPLNWRAPKQNFSAAMNFADSAAAPGEVIATADVTSLIYGPFYRRDWPVVRSSRDLDSMRVEGPVWLMYTFPRYLAVFDPRIAETVARECRTAARFRGTVGDGDVIVCRLGRT